MALSSFLPKAWEPSKDQGLLSICFCFCLHPEAPPAGACWVQMYKKVKENYLQVNFFSNIWMRSVWNVNVGKILGSSREISVMSTKFTVSVFYLMFSQKIQLIFILPWPFCGLGSGIHMFNNYKRRINSNYIHNFPTPLRIFLSFSTTWG